ncbi:MAG: signal peptidase II [Nevskia sp.]
MSKDAMTTETTSRPFDNLRLLGLTLGVIVIDQLSKYMIASRMALYASVPVVPHFNLVCMHNTGAAFSMFNTAPAAMFILLSAVVGIGILWWLRRNRHGQVLVAAAFTLILGGALGNAIDRATRGYVVDFVQFYVGDWSFAAFNVADSAITVGAGLLLLDMLLQAFRERGAGRKPAG